MIFDISFVSQAGSPQEICRLAAMAEKSGFGTVWMAHDLLSDNAWVLCGAVAGATSKINVGPGIVNPYSCSLPEIAMTAASLDNLSKGRCVLGIGPGAKRLLLDGKIRQTQVMHVMEEAVAYLKKVLSPGSGTLRVPVNRMIPIYLGCQSPRLMEQIGRWSVGALPLLTPPSYAYKAFALMRKGAELAGVTLKESDLVASVFVSLGKNENEAERTFADFIVSIIPHLSYHQLGELGITKKEISDISQRYSEEGFEALPSKVFGLGAVGVENCLKAVEEVKRAGFARVKFGTPLGPDKETAISIFAKNVIPHFCEA